MSRWAAGLAAVLLLPAISLAGCDDVARVSSEAAKRAAGKAGSAVVKEVTEKVDETLRPYASVAGSKEKLGDLIDAACDVEQLVPDADRLNQEIDRLAPFESEEFRRGIAGLAGELNAARHSGVETSRLVYQGICSLGEI